MWPCCDWGHNGEGVEILVVGKLHSLLFWIPEVTHPFFLVAENWGLEPGPCALASCTIWHALRWVSSLGFKCHSIRPPSPQPDLPALQDTPNNPLWTELWTLNPLPPAAPPHLLLFKWNNRHKELKCWCNSWASFFKRNCTPHHLVIAICWTST